MKKILLVSIIAVAASTSFAFAPTNPEVGGLNTPIRGFNRALACAYFPSVFSVTGPQTIVGIRYKQDLPSTAAWPAEAVTWPSYTIKMGTSNKLATDGEFLTLTPTINSYFDTGDSVVTRSGALTMDANALPAGGGWGPVIPFSTSWTWNGTAPMIIAIELIGHGNTTIPQALLSAGLYATNSADCIISTTTATFDAAPNTYGDPVIMDFVTATTISGSLTLENTSGANAAESIAWTLTPTAGGSSFTGTLNITDTAPGNAYSFNLPSGAANGSYTLKFKGGTFLSKTISVLLTGSSLTGQDATLKNGDIDQDTEVGPGDFEAVVAQFGNSGDADVDNDGEVGPSDFETVVANFGLGDE